MLGSAETRGKRIFRKDVRALLPTGSSMIDRVRLTLANIAKRSNLSVISVTLN